MHELVAERLGTDDDLPCADYALLVPLKRSRAYGAVRKRVADLRPSDAWLQDGLHFFVFDLHPAPGAPGAAPTGAPTGAPAEGPVAVFTPAPGGAEPEIVDLLTAAPSEPAAASSPPSTPS